MSGARCLIETSRSLALSKTVILELECALRRYYRFDRVQVGQVFVQLLTFSQLELEDRFTVERALALHAEDLDCADALHHTCYFNCESMAIFDDRGLARVVEI